MVVGREGWRRDVWRVGGGRGFEGVIKGVRPEEAAGACVTSAMDVAAGVPAVAYAAFTVDQAETRAWGREPIHMKR